MYLCSLRSPRWQFGNTVRRVFSESFICRIIYRRLSRIHLHFWTVQCLSVRPLISFFIIFPLSQFARRPLLSSGFALYFFPRQMFKRQPLRVLAHSDQWKKLLFYAFSARADNTVLLIVDLLQVYGLLFSSH